MNEEIENTIDPDLFTADEGESEVLDSEPKPGAMAVNPPVRDPVAYSTYPKMHPRAVRRTFNIEAD
jgi:hypothetical protein